MISLEDRERVKKLVIEAFDSVSKPSEIVCHDCEECENLRQVFKRSNWRASDSDLIADYAWDLPLLSPEAFRYFLPGWIMATLNEWDDPFRSDVFQPTIYGKIVPRTSDNDWLRDRYVFSKKQKNAICEFLKLIRQEAIFYNFHNEADAGLRMYEDRRIPSFIFHSSFFIVPVFVVYNRRFMRSASRAPKSKRAAAAFYDLDGTLVKTNLVHALFFQARNQQGILRSISKTATVISAVPAFLLRMLTAGLLFRNYFSRCTKANRKIVSDFCLRNYLKM